jgi:hypothetical protein
MAIVAIPVRRQLRHMLRQASLSSLSMFDLLRRDGLEAIVAGPLESSKN